MSLLFWNDFIEYECPRIAIKSPYLMQTHFNQNMLKHLWKREMRRDSKAYLLRSMGVSVTAQQHAFVRRNDKRWLVLSSNGFVKQWMTTGEDDEEDDYEERVARYNKEPHLFTPPPKRRNRNDDGSEGVEREGARDNRRHRSPISPLEGGSLLSPTVPPARKRSRADARLTIRNSSEGSPYCPANVKKFLELLLHKLSLPNPPTLGSSTLFQEFVATIGESNGEQWRKQMEEKLRVFIEEKNGCIIDTRNNDDSTNLHLKDDTEEEWRKTKAQFDELKKTRRVKIISPGVNPTDPMHDTN
ncbi:hypothetical protein CAEBREN_01546 [Caenorhabditis brenneri]|uniref:SPK domain-containing protein n=1 Tax=Caenorhabditis brenneri TaxID=135651 RepID=G0PHH9_CAEBE|nr:hypothetical protein CAEBREN_01546 [Caenorhabditis brenneri]